MRKILVLKLTRMGDIIEAGPLLRAIRSSEANASITMVVNEIFRPAAELLDDVDSLLTFPIYEYARELRDGFDGLLDLYGRLERFADQLAEEEYDLVLNATNSQLSGVLMGFVRARQRRGLWYDDDGARQAQGPFLRYFAPNEGMRRFCAFNLSDFMRQLYGGPSSPCLPRLRVSDAARGQISTLLESKRQRPLVGLQLGASEACKRWRVEAFAELACNLLSLCDVDFVMLGSIDERPLVDAFLEEIGADTDRVFDLVGKTSLECLAAAAERLDLLITNDTGTMHLAAGLEVKTINLSLGSAFFRETGPYGRGHLILEPRIGCRPCDFLYVCEHFDCKKRIRPEDVASLAACLLEGGDTLADKAAAIDSIDVFQTTFDEDGVLDYARLNPVALEADEVLMHVYRGAICLSELGGEADKRLEQVLGRLVRDGTGLRPDAPERLSEAGRQLKRLETLSCDGISYAGLALEAAEERNIELLDSLLTATGNLDREIAEVGTTHQDCRFLTRGFLLEKEALRGDQIGLLLRGHAAAYRGLRQSAGWCAFAVEKALDLFGSDAQ